MTQVIPLRDRVVVKKIEDELKTKSGLTLPDDVKERPTKGVVLEVGEGAVNDNGTLIPLVTKKGDTVLYPKYAGHPIKVNNEEYLILEEKEILAKLVEAE
jgi:chaperonin GroES